MLHFVCRQPAAPVMPVLRSTGSGSDTDHSIPGLHDSSGESSDVSGDDPLLLSDEEKVIKRKRTARYGSETRVLTPYLIGRLGRYGGTKAGSCCISFAGNRRPL